MDEFGHRFPSLLADGGLWVAGVCAVQTSFWLRTKQAARFCTLCKPFGCVYATPTVLRFVHPRPSPMPDATRREPWCGLADPAMVWPQSNLRRSKALDVTPWLVTHVARENVAYGLTSFLSRPTMPPHATRPHAGRETDA